MRNPRTRLAGATATAALAAATVLLSACGSSGGGSSTTTSGQASGGHGASAAQVANAGQGQNAIASHFDPKDFAAPATGANQFLPLKPGTQWTREGSVNVGNRQLTHQVISTVTDVSKPV